LFCERIELGALGTLARLPVVVVLLNLFWWKLIRRGRLLWLRGSFLKKGISRVLLEALILLLII